MKQRMPFRKETNYPKSLCSKCTETCPELSKKKQCKIWQDLAENYEIQENSINIPKD